MRLDTGRIEFHRRLGFALRLFQIASAQVKRRQPEVEEGIPGTLLRRRFEFAQRSLEISVPEQQVAFHEMGESLRFTWNFDFGLAREGSLNRPDKRLRSELQVGHPGGRAGN